MKLFWILCGCVAAIIFLVLLTAFICFYMAFYVPRKDKKEEEEFSLPPGKIYEPFRDTMLGWMKEVKALPHDEICITSFDGLKLYGKYYECIPGAPIELMMHGYRGRAERDLCGGVQRCFSLGHNALIVDQRACGKSEGRVITFGVNESRDCISWVEYINNRFGTEVQIMLTGISMGASTVLMATSHPLPQNVVAVLADCGFTSAHDIIKKVIHGMELPANLLYPFVRLGAKLYGGFNTEETPAVAAMRQCKLPVIFFHGEADAFVPCEMSRENFDACTAPKKLYTVPDAGHGLSYLVDRENYIRVLAEFCNDCGMQTSTVSHS